MGYPRLCESLFPEHPLFFQGFFDCLWIEPQNCCPFYVEDWEIVVAQLQEGLFGFLIFVDIDLCVFNMLFGEKSFDHFAYGAE